MDARETLEKAVKFARGDIQKNWAALSERDRDIAELGVRRVIAAGFTIMSKEDVEAIRDKALEEAAEIAQYIPTPADVQDHALRLGYISASQAIATAIRAMKEVEAASRDE